MSVVFCSLNVVVKGMRGKGKMSEADKAMWAAILKSKRAVEAARELWRGAKWSGLSTAGVFAIWSACTGLGYGDTLKFMIYCTVALYLNPIINVILTKYELKIVTAESELAHRLDQLELAN
jgi:hypothetical protein